MRNWMQQRRSTPAGIDFFLFPSNRDAVLCVMQILFGRIWYAVCGRQFAVPTENQKPPTADCIPPTAHRPLHTAYCKLTIL
jgi:hypothetical protein